MSQRPRRKEAHRSDLYTLAEAARISRIPKSTLIAMAERGQVEKIVPPGRKYGYYSKKQIDELAVANRLYLLQDVTSPSEFTQATPDDIPGIYEVVAALWGGAKTTPADLRRQWYEKNPHIDYVVKQNGIVTGYFSMLPLAPGVLNLMLSGKKRGWQITPEDIESFQPGREYDVFAGIAVRNDIPYQERYGRRLLAGMFRTFVNLSQQDIRIRRIYAVSDQEDGMKLCNDMGFERMPAEEGDLFNRYCLDLETSESPFAKRFRSLILL
jgi:hypothetical protein